MLQPADDQTLDPISAMVLALRGISPGQGGATAPPQPTPADIAQDRQQDAAPPQGGPNPLAAALSGSPAPSIVPDGQGGYVPSTNSRVAPDGSFLPAQPNGPALARVLAGAGPAPPSASPAVPSPQAGGAPGAPPAVGLNAGGGAATDIRGDASDTAPAEDATAAAYRNAYDAHVKAGDQAMALARQASAAGKDPKAFIEIAKEAYKAADDYNKLGIEYGKPEDTSTTETKNYEYGQTHPGFVQPTTQILQLNNGTFQTVNKATGEKIGDPVGAPSVAPRPVTDDERQHFGLPAEGAFTIAPGEAPKQISGAGTKDQPLDQKSIDWLANRLNQGDSTAISNLGFGSAANRAAVVKRAAELATAGGADSATAASTQIGNQVSLGGQKQGARTSGALGARIDTFAEEANQSVPQALAASDALPRGQWVPINKIEQMGEAAASNPALSRFQAANNALVNTYAKAVNPSGVVTVETQRHAYDILNMAKSPEAYRAAVLQLQTEMGIVQNAVHAVEGHYTGQGGQAPTAAPGPQAPPAPRVRVYDPTTGTLK